VVLKWGLETVLPLSLTTAQKSVSFKSASSVETVIPSCHGICLSPTRITS
jgi:hypothetical protein